MIMADIALWLITAVLCTLHLERASSSSQQQGKENAKTWATKTRAGVRVAYVTDQKYV